MTAPVIDHIGIIVADLDLAATMIAELLPGAPMTRRDLPEVGLEVVEFAAANIIVELLHYCDGGSGFAAQVMGTRPGLNHLSAEVGDIGQAVADLTAAGFQVQDGFPRRGAHGRIAFFAPDPVTGLLFEICQPDAARGR